MTSNNFLSIGQVSQMLNVSIDTLRRWDKKGYLKSQRLTPESPRRYSKASIHQFLQEKGEWLVLAEEWVRHDVSLPLPEFIHCPTRDVFTARLTKMEQVLITILHQETAAVLTALVGEIGNNAFDHNLGNWTDLPGLLFAYQTEKKQIVLADRGQGVLKTLKRVQPDLKTHKESLKTAFTKVISGRAPEIRGNGLKFVKQIVTHYPFHLCFQTGDVKLKLEKGSDFLDFQMLDFNTVGCMAIIDF